MLQLSLMLSHWCSRGCSIKSSLSNRSCNNKPVKRCQYICTKCQVCSVQVLQYTVCNGYRKQCAGTEVTVYSVLWLQWPLCRCYSLQCAVVTVCSVQYTALICLAMYFTALHQTISKYIINIQIVFEQLLSTTSYKFCLVRKYFLPS